MRIWLITDRIVSIILLALFTAASVLLITGKQEKVLSVFFKLAGEAEREKYDGERITGALKVFCGGLAVTELLNVLFAETVYVPAVCMIATGAACVAMILYTDRRCRKRRERPAMDMGDEEVSELSDGRNIENE